MRAAAGGPAGESALRRATRSPRAAALLSVAFFLACPGAFCGPTIRAGLSIGPQAAPAAPAGPDLAAGAQRLFNSQLGSLVSVEFGASPSGAPPGPSALVSIDAADDVLVVATDFSADGTFRAGTVRSLLSRVPAGSPSALAATISGDLAFLFFSARGFSTLPLSAPPALVASVGMEALGELTGWNPEELEPVGISGHGDEITVCFPHRYLTLGPLGTVNVDTARDLQAQGAGREPLQLSAVIAGPRGRLVLLSGQAGAIVTADPRLGMRAEAPAPGLSALPARLFGPDAVVCLPGSSLSGLGRPGPNAGLLVYPLGGAARAPRRIPVAASYLSALDRDAEGNLWVWDAGERRIRVLTTAGREVHSIRPLLGASTMPLPQQLTVLDDGSFLLAGSSEVWKFQSSGIPVWRLSRIPGRPGESLPASMDVAADRADGTFTLLDQQSRRLLVFSPAPDAEQAPLASLLARLDGRKPAELEQASAVARRHGLDLAAWGYAEAAASSGGTDRERTLTRLALLSEKAAAFAQLAAGLDRDLLPARADGAYLRAAETLRELTAEAPADDAAATMLQEVLARRRDVRAELAGPSDVRIVSARLQEDLSPDCRTIITLTVNLRNVGTQPLGTLRVHAGVPAWGLSPALASIDSLGPSEEQQVVLPMGYGDDENSADSSPTAAAAILVTYERGEQGFSSAVSAEAAVASAPARGPAQALACRAVGSDTLSAGLPDSILSGPRPADGSPVADLAGVLDSLEHVRALALAAGQAPEGPPRMRAALRALGPDESDWSVVTVSLASSLGLQASLLWRAGRPLALVDTGTPLPQALTALPALARFQEELQAVSTGGTLWIPLSGRAPPRVPHPLFWALRDGLALLGEPGTGAAERADLSTTAPAPNAPIPFPLVVPVTAPRLSGEDILAAAASALSTDAAPSTDAAGASGR